MQSTGQAVNIVEGHYWIHTSSDNDIVLETHSSLVSSAQVIRDAEHDFLVGTESWRGYAQAVQ